MDKETWIQHIEREGIYRPSRGGDKELWKSIVSRHQVENCPICKDRAKTKRANNNRKAREEAYRSCGLTKVIGAVSGKVYWE